MIKFSELKQGDYVLVKTDGQTHQGEVTNFNFDEKEIEINNGVQEFYFKSEDLFPIPLDEEQLLKLKFTKQVDDEGSVKYSKGAFRIRTSEQDKFSDFQIWYRDETRHIQQHIALHELQNHYLAMTKVHLTNRPV